MRLPAILTLLLAPLAMQGAYELGTSRLRTSPCRPKASAQALHAEAPAYAAAKPDFHAVSLASNTSQSIQIKKFRAGYNPQPESVMSLPAMSACSGAGDGSGLRLMGYTVNGSGSITSVDWMTIDPTAGRIISKKPQDYALGVCMDMTYDPTTSTYYGISAVADILVKIDGESGQAEAVASTLPFYTLSCDPAGNMYAIALNTQTGQGDLYSVNKSTGASTRIGATGVKMLTDQSGQIAYFQTAEFSRADGNLYWCVTTAESVEALCRVNVQTGQATYLAPFPDGDMMVSLFDLTPPQDPDSPAVPSEVKAEVEGSSVKISCVAPTLTVSGTPLTDLLEIALYADGAEPLHTWESPSPGGPLEYIHATPKQGTNAYRLVCSNASGSSLPVYATTFVGEDFPQGPGNLRIYVGEDGYPCLSWEAPTMGLNGLPVDPATLKYNVYREDGRAETCIANAITTLSHTDTSLDLSRQTYPYYRVRAVSEAGEGNPSQAVGTYCGPAYPLPFAESFDDCNPKTSPWIMQSIDLGGQWELNYISTFPGSGPYDDAGMLVFIGFRSVEGAEARIATPLLDFSAASSPELRFHFYYLDMAAEDLRFDDWMEVEASVEGSDFQPVPQGKFVQHDADTRWTECTVPLPHLAGKKKVALAFHGHSGGGFDLLVDNIRVKESDPGSIPAVTLDATQTQAWDLHGRPVDLHTAPAGIYLQRRSGKTSKVIISH